LAEPGLLAPPNLNAPSSSPRWEGGISELKERKEKKKTHNNIFYCEVVVKRKKSHKYEII
jgi:hypothetical protein